MTRNASGRPGTSTRLPLAVASLAAVLALAALVVSVIALVQGGSDDSSPSYSESQRSADTRTVCDAFALNLKAVSIQTGSQAPAGESGVAAAAANARLALFAAGVNLTDALESAPAAPDALRSAVTDLAKQYRTVATQYLADAGVNSTEVAAAKRSAGTAATSVSKACT
ncbi:hypothetical protein OG579_11490 [Williamsia herbipolensis]|uniref:Alanine and proline rich membrane protein n=1 Tax=Williamsia herbipolensis TaxID=1603258 RepID=A0AAU4JX51_9NOCA|nr:hypothetical protein [Williamsia herbipolensis]